MSCLDYVVKIHDSSDEFLGERKPAEIKHLEMMGKHFCFMNVSRILLVAENRGILGIFFKKELLPSAYPLRAPPWGRNKGAHGLLQNQPVNGEAGHPPIHGERVYVKGDT